MKTFIPAATARTSNQPNIVFILADDLGYGDVACYNAQTKVPTPNLDKLATEGMRFTDAHSPSTVCTPTRYSLLTGQMAFRIGKGGVFTGVGGPCLTSIATDDCSPIESSVTTRSGRDHSERYRFFTFPHESGSTEVGGGLSVWVTLTILPIGGPPGFSES